MEIKDKVVVITGANGGIGSAIARKLDKEGCFLVLAARTIESLTDLKKDLKTNYLEVEMDVANSPVQNETFIT